MKRTWLLCGMALLAGCAGVPAPSPEQKDIALSVDKKVATACVPDTLGAPPSFASMKAALLAAPTMAAQYKLALADVVILVDRETQVEPVISHCRAPSAAQ